MEEEKKRKRVRPTWQQVHELENIIERQCEELRGWKEQFHANDGEDLKRLTKLFDELQERSGDKDKALEAQRKRIKELEEKESELNATTSELASLHAEYEEIMKQVRSMEVQVDKWKEYARERDAKLMEIESLGFFARVFKRY